MLKLIKKASTDTEALLGDLLERKEACLAVVSGVLLPALLVNFLAAAMGYTEGALVAISLLVDLLVMCTILMFFVVTFLWAALGRWLITFDWARKHHDSVEACLFISYFMVMGLGVILLSSGLLSSLS